MDNEEKTASLNLGSRLKTPIVPIWIVVASEHSGVLFGDDKQLLRDYHGENKYEHFLFSSDIWLEPHTAQFLISI